MEALPDIVVEYLKENVEERLTPAYLCASGQGEVLGWGGSYAFYGLAAIEAGDPIDEHIPLLVGLGQPDENLVFPMVNLPDAVANIHVLPRKAGGVYVLLLDATQEHDSRQIYQQKANEVQLLNARLKKVLAELRDTQAELVKKKAEAEEASRLKSRFIAGMSHEFRTPLTSILGYIELVQKGLLKQSQVDASFKAIEGGARHLLSLIDNVLDQARFEAGEMALNPQLAQLGSVIDEVKSLFVPLAREKGLKLIFSVDSDLDAWVNVDSVRLRQIMINLLNNAIKYTDEGSVTVVCRCDDSVLSFSVADTGPGIELEQQEKIFTAFHRVKGQAGKAGAGLGLAITRQILEMMGGGLTLDSTPGEGSVFSLQLPLDVVSIEPAPTTEKLYQTGEFIVGSSQGDVVEEPHQACVLVAEDNPDVVEMIELFLESAGIEVLKAETGRIAVDKALGRQPDLVLMDMNMPEISGYEATRQLRAQAYEKPILALTASPSPLDRQQAIDAGCNNYLLKPISMDELLSQVLAYLE